MILHPMLPWAVHASSLSFHDQAIPSCIVDKQSFGGLINLQMFQLQWSSQKHVLGHASSSQPYEPIGQPSDGLSVAISNFVIVKEYKAYRSLF